MDHMSEDELAQRVIELELKVAALTEVITDINTRLQSVTLDVASLDIQTLVARSTSRAMQATTSASLPEYVASANTQDSSEVPPPKRSLPIISLSVESTRPFIYSQIPKDQPLVRILALKKSTREDDPIECRLISLDLNDIQQIHVSHRPEHDFTPLSYTWGDFTHTKAIYIQGAHLYVTTQLHRAMTCLRKLGSNLSKEETHSNRSWEQDSGESFWWIDAICVNQQDLDERSHQVSLMTRLYRSAKLVHVWLGDEDENTATAMGLVHSIAYRPSTFDDIQSWGYIRKPGQTHRPAGPGIPDVRLPDEGPALSEKEKRDNFRAITSLFNRPWFSRVWVRQEIALPSAITINCGSYQCMWEELMRTASTVSCFADDLAVESLQTGKALAHSEIVSCFQNAMALDEVRAATSRGASYIAFTDLVFHTRDCLATDGRDKVYAMLPMTNPDEIPTKADYRVQTFEAYEAVLIPLLSSNLNFLAACQNQDVPSDRPSWIPDFAQTWIAHPIWPYLSDQRSLRDPDFRAGAPIIEHSISSLSLAVHGVILDTIDRISPAHASANATHTTLRALIKTWYKFSHDRRRELLDETTATKIDWQTIRWINSCYDEDVWEEKICLDPNWDTSSRKPQASKNLYTPMGGRPLKDDPTFRRVRDSLIISDYYSNEATTAENTGITLSEARGLSHFRRMAVGRRAAMTTQGLTCLVPEYAQLGDVVAWFKGSTETFVLRPRGEQEWSVVGSTCKCCLSEMIDSRTSMIFADLWDVRQISCATSTRTRSRTL
jgi:cation transport regulator ChaB/uncharacterized coiled-coil protein SlyX